MKIRNSLNKAQVRAADSMMFEQSGPPKGKKKKGTKKKERNGHQDAKEANQSLCEEGGERGLSSIGGPSS